MRSASRICSTTVTRNYAGDVGIGINQHWPAHQNADLVLAIGPRLEMTTSGYSVEVPVPKQTRSCTPARKGGSRACQADLMIPHQHGCVRKNSPRCRVSPGVCRAHVAVGAANTNLAGAR